MELVDLSCQLDDIVENAPTDENLLYHNKIYGGIDLSAFDPLNENLCSPNHRDRNNSSCDFLKRTQNNYNCDFELPAQTENSTCVSGEKLSKFLLSAEEFFADRGLEALFPRGINDEQKLIMIFYRLFKHLHVPTVEITYLSAKNMGIYIPECVYKILKVCRLSYHGSLALYEDLGNYTRFHPYFYEHILKSTLNLAFQFNDESGTDYYKTIVKVFMAARYYKIELCGRTINRIFLFLSLCARFELLEVVLDYAVKTNVAPLAITLAFQYFVKHPSVYEDFFSYFCSNSTEVISIHYALFLNHLLIVVCSVPIPLLVEKILKLMPLVNAPLSVEALDSLFSSLPATSHSSYIELVLPTINFSLSVPFGQGPFAVALWKFFELTVESNNGYKAISLLPFLIHTDASLVPFSSNTRLQNLGLLLFTRK